MLEPPAIANKRIAAAVQQHYGLKIATVEFLPLGADIDTAVYRLETANSAVFFLKLRRGTFPEATVAIPAWLAQRGVPNLIAPLPTHAGLLWATLAPFTMILSPFIDGRSGWRTALSAAQWAALGTTLRALHAAAVPPELAATLAHEDFGAYWREQVAGYLRQASAPGFAQPELGAWLLAHRSRIQGLLGRAERLAHALRAYPRPFCLCHGDIHAGNVLLDPAGRLFVVDWDTLVRAPKERDLMFIGAGIGGIWQREEEAAQFFQGYGRASVDRAALAYYRSERIVQDVAAYCRDLLGSDVGAQDRAEMFAQLSGQFAPGSVVDIAEATADA